MRSLPISTGLFKSYVGQHVPLWVAFAAAWLVFLVLPLGILAPDASIQYADSQFYAGWSAEYVGSIVGAAIAGIASVVCVFEYVFNRDAALFAGSLPVSRTKLFMTSYLAGLLPLLVIELVVFVIVALMSVAIPAIGTGYCLAWLALTAGFTFVLYSVAAFCAMLTGTKTAAYYLYLLVIAFVPLLELVLRGIASACIWGVDLLGGIPTLLWTSPLFGMGYYVLLPRGDMWASITEIDWLALLAYVAVAVVLVACSVVLSKRRHLERAGNAVAVKVLEVVSKLVTGVALAALLAAIATFCMSFASEFSGTLDTGQRVLLGVVCFVGGFLGVFFGEGLNGSGPGIFKRCWKMGLATAVVCALFIVGCGADAFGIKRYVPQPDQVASVEVQLENEFTTLSSPENIDVVTKAHNKIFDYESFSDNLDGRHIGFTYKLKDGRTVSRSYNINAADPIFAPGDEESSSALVNAGKMYRSLCKVCDSVEGVKSRFTFADGNAQKPTQFDVYYGKDMEDIVDLTAKGDLGEFVGQALMKDIEEHGFGKSFTSEDGVSVGYVEIAGRQASNSWGSNSYVLTTKNCPNMARWLKTHYGVDILK